MPFPVDTPPESNIMKKIIASLLLSVAATSVSADPIKDAVASSERPAEQRIRDEFRNPQQTLHFFDIQPEMTVVEISPGGGWYSNILAPLLKDNGQYYAAHFYVDENTRDYFRKSREKFEQKIKTHAPYKNVKLTAFHTTKGKVKIAPDNSADKVLTFRNVHNWYMRGGDEAVLSAFQQFYAALQQGGELGVVEHRLPESAEDKAQEKSGYMKQSYVVKMAEKAGFKFLESSEINANLKDTAQHPKGVWTLPPRLALGEENASHYMAIGESDRMTLKFVKP